MPNHVHFIIHPPDDLQVGKVIGEIKSTSGKEILKQWKKKEYKALNRLRRESGEYSFWQRRCYDHNCRTPESVLEKIEYCHNNPVRSGLVNEPGQWIWSSYNWYQGKTAVPLEIDGYEM